MRIPKNTVSLTSKTVKFFILPLFITTLFFSCSGESHKDDQFCKCMEVGDTLNKFSAELLERPATKEDEKKMQKLRETSKKECASYYEMSGTEMRKKKAACQEK